MEGGRDEQEERSEDRRDGVTKGERTPWKEKLNSHAQGIDALYKGESDYAPPW